MSVGLVARPRLGASLVRAEVRERTEPRARLWSLDDLRRLIRMLALSGTGLVVAWLVASGTTDLPRQEMAVAGGIVATTVALAGLSGWLLAGMRGVRELRDDAVRNARGLIVRRSATIDSPALAGDLVTAQGMTHQHLASCLMVRGKAVRAASGLAPCPICRPGEPS